MSLIWPTGHSYAPPSEAEWLQLCSLQGCGPKARKCTEAAHRAEGPWKPVQIPPPPPFPCEPQDSMPKPCPEAAALGSHQPRELGALQDLPNCSGGTPVQLCLYHLWLRNTRFTAEPLCNLQSFFFLCKWNKATFALRGLPIAAPVSSRQKTVFSQSAHT